ncbi:uncharacterized protein B0H18DRAFT_1129220 [Fomitopsis serialis]|uniref:uncharacterized protein n=1 Tax=Fomitopsis serialis TaxID=139415 RepID=UPI002007EC04|nr:uncharacterized protein B0H18DRAFT_1129220 [Neoantrodia serialis]KAH9910961.1 hypothetical protein B0H18DRAFT_1129220 [Neoantrodia serialis]
MPQTRHKRGAAPKQPNHRQTNSTPPSTDPHPAGDVDVASPTSGSPNLNNSENSQVHSGDPTSTVEAPAAAGPTVGPRPSPDLAAPVPANTTNGQATVTSSATGIVNLNIPEPPINPQLLVIPGPPAPTQTHEELQHMICNLEAQIIAMQQNANPMPAVNPPVRPLPNGMAAPTQNGTAAAPTQNGMVPPALVPGHHGAAQVSASNATTTAVVVPAPNQMLVSAQNTGTSTNASASTAASGNTAGRPPPMIPRPKGTAGEDYNLQEAMGLANDPATYRQIKVSLVMLGPWVGENSQFIEVELPGQEHVS